HEELLFGRAGEQSDGGLGMARPRARLEFQALSSVGAASVTLPRGPFKTALKGDAESARPTSKPSRSASALVMPPTSSDSIAMPLAGNASLGCSPDHWIQSGIAPADGRRPSPGSVMRQRSMPPGVIR